ncbi:carbohydrate binding domain-containing protein, partial [Ideonella sp.]|uniref:carbohydrate binding domain-containing protein n=1 Tax=Ideonella sp. TaxID=1929293 RepID=UPI003BB7D1BE
MRLSRTYVTVLGVILGVPLAASAATTTVYYYTPTKNWSSVFVHHNASGSWTAIPGTRMTAACTNWVSQTIDFSTSNFQLVFNNGSGAWDNPPGGGNYVAAAGVHQVKNGALVANAGNPCTTGNQTATVYYRPNTAWTTVNLHYAPNGGAWTAVPGVAMEGACPGWRSKTVALGAATGLAAVFNNGSGTWDNNAGRNYALAAGTSKVENGVVSTGNPCSDTTPPSVPGGLTLGAVTPSSIAFSWQASTDNVAVALYEVYRDGGLMGTTTVPNWVANGLALNTSYTFTVKAKDGTGNVSAASAGLTARTATDTTAPSAPGGLSGSASGTTINLSWTASSDNVGVTGYEVLRTGGSQGNKTVSTTGLGLSDTGLSALTSYTYTVKAMDAAGNRSTGSSVTVQTGDVSTPTAGTPLGTDMREDSIYFVMTARFYDGDSSNNRGGAAHVTSGNAANNDPMFRGDFKGLIQKLDYIKSLGFSAIWITPVVLNRSDYDYHGYHGWDFYRIDPRLESAGATYQDLINTAHAKGIKIIQDVVYNHSSRWGAKGLFTPKVFGVRDTQWSWYYDQPNPAFNYDGLSIEPTSGKSYYNGDIWSTPEPAGNTCRNWGVPTGSFSKEGYKIYNCQWPNPTSGMFAATYYHQCWIGNWEGEDSRSCWIHEDLADFNTESAPVQAFLKDVHNRFIDMGVDGFRVDTAVHIPRVMWNRHFLPEAHAHAQAKFGAKGKHFYMVGEVGAFVNDKWNRGSPNHSAQFFTWKERATYSANDSQASLEQYNFEQAQGTGNQPTSANAFLNGNNYRTPDRSQFSGLNVIDMRMHMNFGDANNAYWNGKDSDDSYNDATYNMVYVDSHDYGPNKSSSRYTGGTAAWAENMSLMWTFRGIPTLFYGSEVEFQAGKPIDCGPTCPLATTGRAYFGDKLEGSVTAADFGVVGSASGAVATTLSQPLVKHVQRLNQI